MYVLLVSQLKSNIFTIPCLTCLNQLYIYSVQIFYNIYSYTVYLLIYWKLIIWKASESHTLSIFL